VVAYKKTGTSRPMKLVTVWFTEEEKARLDELARERKITVSKALREGAVLYFKDAQDWIEARRGEDHGVEARSA
jgi:predicted transcriptional regulator